MNVQFPDTLLWKRRYLQLDSQGYVVLSASQSSHGASAAAAVTKRYHMSDLKMPFVPDIEEQEMPNSVTLDFVQGGGLQFACEDRAAQGHVLHCEFWYPYLLYFEIVLTDYVVLEDAHKAWASSEQ